MWTTGQRSNLRCRGGGYAQIGFTLPFTLDDATPPLLRRMLCVFRRCGSDLTQIR